MPDRIFTLWVTFDEERIGVKVSDMLKKETGSVGAPPVSNRIN